MVAMGELDPCDEPHGRKVRYASLAGGIGWVSR